MLGQVQRPVLVLELRALLSAQGGHAAGEDHGEPVGAGIDHSRLAQHRQLLGTALDRLLGGLQRILEHLGEQLVLLLVGRLGAEPLGVHVGEVVGHAPRHGTDRGEHRPLGRVVTDS